MTTVPSLRPATDRDDAFLQRLYATTRAEEMAGTGWSAAQQREFLQAQFAARQKSYRAQFHGADWSVLTVHSRTVGAMIVHRTAAEIRLVDIALLPGHRGQGMGSALLENLKTEAARTDRPLRLSVLKSNPARRLYERMGFGPVGFDGEYIRFEMNMPK
jgi:GNAT superfamily N-acetyltransferase